MFRGSQQGFAMLIGSMGQQQRGASFGREDPAKFPRLLSNLQKSSYSPGPAHLWTFGLPLGFGVSCGDFPGVLCKPRLEVPQNTALWVLTASGRLRTSESSPRAWANPTPGSKPWGTPQRASNQLWIKSPQGGQLSGHGAPTNVQAWNLHK